MLYSAEGAVIVFRRTRTETKGIPWAVEKDKNQKNSYASTRCVHTGTPAMFPNVSRRYYFVFIVGTPNEFSPTLSNQHR